jgi:hypothetical protein
VGYDLVPENPDAGGFHFSAWTFPVLLEACGYLYTCVQRGPRWHAVFGPDPRMGPPGSRYPRLISNDGFPVSDEEARIMARVASNFVLLNRPDPGTNIEPVQHIRADFLDRFEAFSQWAENCGGFAIW